MTLIMATRQSAKWFLVEIGKSQGILFIGVRLRAVVRPGSPGLSFGLRAGFRLPLGLVGVENGLHGKPEKQAHHQGRQQYGNVFHGSVPFRLQQREQDGFADARPGEKHHQPVDAQADTAHGRGTVLQRAQEVLIQLHGFVVAGSGVA